MRVLVVLGVLGAIGWLVYRFLPEIMEKDGVTATAAGATEQALDKVDELVDAPV